MRRRSDRRPVGSVRATVEDLDLGRAPEHEEMGGVVSAGVAVPADVPGHLDRILLLALRRA
jgi:hypothetical protein